MRTPLICGLGTAVGTTCLVLPLFIPLPPTLLWNTSASVPVGLYRLTSLHAPDRGALVAVIPDQPLASFMVRRGYIGRDTPLLKQVAALPGQEVCRSGVTISIDGTAVGTVLLSDRNGRPMPSWQGCRRLSTNELFLMNTAVPDSFDGRYFGATPLTAVIGNAHLIYAVNQRQSERISSSDTH